MLNKWERQLSYEDVFKELQESKIKYLVIGGIAVNLHGFQRTTGDIDIMLAMESENVLKFIKIAKKLNLAPRVPVKPEDFADPKKVENWKKYKNMKVFSFIDIDNPAISIDIMTENYIPFDESYKRRKNVKAWGITIPVVSIEDLIKLKKISGRPQDLADIEALEQFPRQKK